MGNYEDMARLRERQASHDRLAKDVYRERRREVRAAALAGRAWSPALGISEAEYRQVCRTLPGAGRARHVDVPYGFTVDEDGRLTARPAG